MNKDFIYDFADRLLTEERRKHTEGVEQTAEALAKHYGADPDKAKLAARLHDIYRRATDEEIDDFIRRGWLHPSYRANSNLAHAKMAAATMQHELGISDPDLIHAVSFHTTGRQAMSLLEKILFVADAIEPSRSFPGVDDLRALAFRDLDQACILSLSRTIQRLQEKQKPIDRDTIEAYEYMKNKTKEVFVDNRETVQALARYLQQKKGMDIRLIDIGEKASFADYLALCTATSVRHAEALAEEAETFMMNRKVPLRSMEGKGGSGWILADYGDIVINIFSAPMREKYRLEKVWGDCPTVGWEEENE